MTHASIILVHYGLIDDFGALSAGSNPPSRSDLVRRCLESLLENTKDYPAEIIVMDNGGSPDDSGFFLEKARAGLLTLVRFPKNMHFAYAWNMGAKLATGEYLSFVCNDIEFKPTWLPTCVALLEKYRTKGMKVLATPFVSYDKRRNTVEITEDARINTRSGSNCLVIRREDFYAIGEWPHHKKGGTLWYNKMARDGFYSVVPLEDLAVDMGYRAGVNFNIPIEVKKKLTDGSEVHFEAPQQ